MTSDSMKIIARIKTDLPSKFGIPRQSGLVAELKADIIFEKEYRVAEAVRGLEDFSHLWLIWKFSESVRENWSPTVRPPRLGGNERVGVFATRSPFRPNPIGISVVKLEGIENVSGLGMVLHVSGADLMDGTPIYDIKPYLAFADSYPDALGGFADKMFGKKLEVIIPESVEKKVPADKLVALRKILEQDPRPSYQDDPERVYGFPYAGGEVSFRVKDGCLEILDYVEAM